MLTGAQITVDFMAHIKEGRIQPAQMVAVLQTMHSCLIDRYEGISTFMTPDLEQVSDNLVDAMRCAEIQEQDNEEVTL